MPGGEQPLYDEVTGAPLNAAASAILERSRGAASQQRPARPQGADAAAQGVLESIPTVDIAEGKWKYVQIELTAPGEPQKRVVRSARVGYHPEVYELTMNSLARSHGPVVRGTVIGGGRIVYDPSARTVDIYGYSKSFGRAKGCNERSAQIVRDNLPGVEVTWSDKGY